MTRPSPILLEGEDHFRPPPRKSLHHRKPSSLGGSNDIPNLSSLELFDHRLWHTIFGNFWPDEIAEIINKGFFLNLYAKVGCKFIGECTESKKRPSNYIPIAGISFSQRWSWTKLFHGLSNEKIIEIINKEFLDPEYELFIVEDC